MNEACSTNTNREKRNACRLLVGKSEVKRPQGRPKRKWVHLGESEWGWMD
jgi:hypothetical protein